MWKDYISPTSHEDALKALAERGGQARIVAGATDLILELERGQRKGIETLIDVTRVPGLDQLVFDEDRNIHLGPLVTHNHCVASKMICEFALPLAKACWEVGSPQIRNRGTIAGNLITASPANDTITPLAALGAWVTLQSFRNGAVQERKVMLSDFYRGVRKTVMEADEMLVDIAFPSLKPNQHGTFVKYALRRAQAISLVNVAVILTMDADVIEKAQITLGAVAPVIIHAEPAEEFLVGKRLDEVTILRAADLAMQSARPISDVRGSAEYRLRMVKVSTRRALQMIAKGEEAKGFPENPVLLWGKPKVDLSVLNTPTYHDGNSSIVTRINGKECEIKGAEHKSLLHMLREDAGLIGSKEGCAEGECGACTVFLDGVAVMSCMVPAPRAHGAEIVTVEGLASENQLHPVQEAFIEEGAVQCGYCTPGFIMSAVKLLEERPKPSHEDIRQAITGNLCRCTGYYKIIQAIELAAQKGVK